MKPLLIAAAAVLCWTQPAAAQQARGVVGTATGLGVHYLLDNNSDPNLGSIVSAQPATPPARDRPASRR